MGIQRVPNLLRWTVLACCLPYPGDPKSAIDCFFLFGISLHPGVTGSAPHWKFRGCRVHSFPSLQELLRPASWLALLSRTFTFELARRGRPQSASNMTTWINSQFPRPDFHRQVQRHYGLQDTGIHRDELLLCSENPARNWPGGAINPQTPMRRRGYIAFGGACFRGAEPGSKAQTSGHAVVPSHGPSPKTSVGGRREGDILLHVLPKSRGQQYRVRGDVRARLTRGLEAPMIIGLLPDTRLQP